MGKSSDLLSIGIRIQKLREESGITQEQFAKAMNYTRLTVAKWERGIQDLKTQQLVEIADYFNVTVDYLLGRTQAKSLDGNIQAISQYTNLDDTALLILHRQKSILEKNILNSFIIAISDEISKLAVYVNEGVKRHYLEKYILMFKAQTHGINVSLSEIEVEGEGAIKERLGKHSEKWFEFKNDYDKFLEAVEKDWALVNPVDFKYNEYLKKNKLIQIFDDVCKDLLKSELFKEYDTIYKQIVNYMQSGGDENKDYMQPYMKQSALESYLLKPKKAGD